MTIQLMNRRNFLGLAAALGGAAILPNAVLGQERFIREAGSWRKFDLVTKIEFPSSTTSLKAWIPIPSVDQEDWTKPLGSDWRTNAKTAKVEKDALSGAEFVYFEWPDGDPAPAAEVSSHVSVRDRLTDFTQPEKRQPLKTEERALYTRPMTLIADGDELAAAVATIVEKAKTDLGKAKAIYEWIADEKRCGLSPLRALLEPIDPAAPMAPHCSALNRLYVSLARSAGLAAREIAGIRLAPSQFGYASLGAVPSDVTAKVHIRAEVWLNDYGWVPVDVGDLARVVHDEPPGNLMPNEPKVIAARLTLFGAWEGNWAPLNMAQDIALPNAENARAPFLAWPAVMRDGALSLTPGEGFRHRVSAKELPA